MSNCNMVKLKVNIHYTYENNKRKYNMYIVYRDVYYIIKHSNVSGKNTTIKRKRVLAKTVSL